MAGASANVRARDQTRRLEPVRFIGQPTASLNRYILKSENQMEQRGLLDYPFQSRTQSTCPEQGRCIHRLKGVTLSYLKTLRKRFGFHAGDPAALPSAGLRRMDLSAHSYTPLSSG